MLALVLVVPPAGEFPVGDDWVYALTVRDLVQHGRFELSAWIGPSLVLQVYWGALFTYLFGFSHTVLRASTLALAAAGVFGLYALLGHFVSPRRALLGALALLFNPLYVHFAYSFNTNVPFLAPALWALVCGVRGLRPHLGAPRRSSGAAPRPDPGPRTGWLAVGSALAGGAFLVRQMGVALPLAVLGSLARTGGRRIALRSRYLAAIFGPFLPALLLGSYLDGLRGPIRLEPLRWTFDFWATQGAGLFGVVVERVEGALSTLGLMLLPLTLGALLDRSRRRAAGILTLTLLGAFVARTVVSGEGLLLPHLETTLTERGFWADALNGTLPRSVVVPEPVLAVATGGALLGGGLLLLAMGMVSARAAAQGPVAVPLLFGLLATVMSVSYYAFYDNYLLTIIPSGIVAALLGVGPARGRTALAVVGVTLLAAWSIWWQRDYMERQAALWQVGLALVRQGIPPEQIDGGYEWNGWYRGQSVIAAAVQRARAGGPRLRLDTYVKHDLEMPRARWALQYEAPARGSASRVLASVPYGRGHYAVAVQRS